MSREAFINDGVFDVILVRPLPLPFLDQRAIAEISNSSPEGIYYRFSGDLALLYGYR